MRKKIDSLAIKWNFLGKKKKSSTKIPKGKQTLPKEKKKKNTCDFFYRSYKTYFSIIIH